MDSRGPVIGGTAIADFPSEADLGPAFKEADGRLTKRELKKILGENRPLDGWERYRALNDAMDEAYEVMDLSNREARFALLVMGVLNAGVLISASRSPPSLSSASTSSPRCTFSSRPSRRSAPDASARGWVIGSARAPRTFRAASATTKT